MNSHDASVIVEAMFNANGKMASAGVIAELAREVAHAGCDSCAREVIQASHDSGPALNVPGFRTAYRRQFASPDHGLHVAQDDRSVQVGKLEARWHTEGVRALVANGMEPDRAQVAAAMAWASETCDVGSFDANPEVWTRHTPKNISPELIEAAWKYARAIATTPTHDVGDEQWRSVVGPWERAWRAAV